MALSRVARRCAVTGSFRAVDACHVIPRSEGHKPVRELSGDAKLMTDDPSNILPLNPALHRMYDRHLFSFAPNGDGTYHIEPYTSDPLLDECLGRDYRLPARPEFLASHRATCLARRTQNGVLQDLWSNDGMRLLSMSVTGGVMTLRLGMNGTSGVSSGPLTAPAPSRGPATSPAPKNPEDKSAPSAEKRVEERPEESQPTAVSSVPLNGDHWEPHSNGHPQMEAPRDEEPLAGVWPEETVIPRPSDNDLTRDPDSEDQRDVASDPSSHAGNYDGEAYPASQRDVRADATRTTDWVVRETMETFGSVAEEPSDAPQTHSEDRPYPGGEINGSHVALGLLSVPEEPRHRHVLEDPPDEAEDEPVVARADVCGTKAVAYITKVLKTTPGLRLSLPGSTISAQVVLGLVLCADGGPKVDVAHLNTFLKTARVNMQNAPTTLSKICDRKGDVLHIHDRARAQSVMDTYRLSAEHELGSLPALVEACLADEKAGTMRAASAYKLYTLAAILESKETSLTAVTSALATEGFDTGNYASMFDQKTMRFVAARSESRIIRLLGDLSILEPYRKRLEPYMLVASWPAGAKPAARAPAVPPPVPKTIANPAPKPEKPARDEISINKDDLRQSKPEKPARDEISTNKDDLRQSKPVTPDVSKGAAKPKSLTEARLPKWWAPLPVPDGGPPVVVFVSRACPREAEGRRGLLVAYMLARQEYEGKATLTLKEVSVCLHRHGFRDLALPRDIMKDSRFEWSPGVIRLVGKPEVPVEIYDGLSTARDLTGKMMEVLPTLQKLARARPVSIKRTDLLAALAARSVPLNLGRDLPHFFCYPAGDQIILSPHYYKSLHELSNTA
jgi:hypothetical protein